MSKPNSKARRASGKQKIEADYDDSSAQRSDITSPRQTPSGFVSPDDLVNPLARTNLSDAQSSFGIATSSSSRYASSNPGTTLRYNHTAVGAANPYYTPPSSFGSTRSTLSTAYTTSSTSGGYPNQYGKAESSQTAANRSTLGGLQDNNSVYRVRDKKFYNNPGRMIVIMWSEPAGTEESTPNISPGALGDPVFQKPRHFVILRADTQYCLALAIHTHQRQGVAHISHKHQYGIIYTGRSPPTARPEEAPKRGERPMQPIPIRVLPDKNTDTLDPMSRLNYGKIYTIEYKIPTKAFGLIHPDSRLALAQQYQVVQQDSMSNPQLANGTAAAAARAPPVATRPVPPPAVTTRAPPAAATALPADPDLQNALRRLYDNLVNDQGLTQAEARARVRAAALRLTDRHPSDDDDDDDDDEDDDDNTSGSGSGSDSE